MKKMQKDFWFYKSVIFSIVMLLFLTACSSYLALPREANTSGQKVTATVTPKQPKLLVTVLAGTPEPTNAISDGTIARKTPLATTEITPTGTALVTIAPTIVMTVLVQPPTKTPTSLTSKSITPSPMVPTVHPTTLWQPSPLPSEKVIADWLVYTDKEAGYSFKYPPDAIITSRARSDYPFKRVLGFFSADDTQAHMVVFVEENVNNLTFEEYLAKRYPHSSNQPDISSQSLPSIEQIKINGLSAMRNKTHPDSEVFVVIVTQNRIFTFFVVNPAEIGTTRQVSNANKNLFYQILNTFAFASPE